ncbi:hypothetical protein LTR50_003361 [Elasticomyces elasticus]|nr:hypothetical protein LTR50_003361 [Elasticomyces elasticus]
MSSHEYYGGGNNNLPPQQTHPGYNQGQYGAPPPQQYSPQNQQYGHSSYPQQQYPPPLQQPYPSDPYQQSLPPPQQNYAPYQPPPPQYGTHSPAPSYNTQVAPYPIDSQEHTRSYSPYPPPNHHQSGYAPPPLSTRYDQPGYHQGAPAQQRGQYDQGYGGPGGAAEGEKGLGATLVGGAGGAFLGHELGGGPLGLIGGLIAGAVGANALENRHEKYVNALPEISTICGIRDS